MLPQGGVTNHQSPEGSLDLSNQTLQGYSRSPCLTGLLSLPHQQWGTALLITSLETFRKDNSTLQKEEGPQNYVCSKKREVFQEKWQCLLLNKLRKKDINCVF